MTEHAVVSGEGRPVKPPLVEDALRGAERYLPFVVNARVTAA